MASLDPTLWGKSGWIFLHSISLEYPEKPTEEDKNNYKIFYNSIQYVLPCSKCRNNYTKSIQKRKLTDDILTSRDKLINWLIDIRNDEKPGRNITYEYVMNEIGIVNITQNGQNINIPNRSLNNSISSISINDINRPIINNTHSLDALKACKFC